MDSRSVRNVDKRIVNLPDGSQEIVTTTRDQNGRETKTVERVNRSGATGSSLSGASALRETSDKLNSILSQFMK